MNKEVMILIESFADASIETSKIPFFFFFFSFYIFRKTFIQQRKKYITSGNIYQKYLSK